MIDIRRYGLALMLYVIGTLLVAASILSMQVRAASGSKPDNTIRITTYNPYRLSVRLEVKCDHDWKTNRFTFHRFISVPGKQDTVIRVPNNMKECQIWPKIIW